MMMEDLQEGRCVGENKVSDDWEEEEEEEGEGGGKVKHESGRM